MGRHARLLELLSLTEGWRCCTRGTMAPVLVRACGRALTADEVWWLLEALALVRVCAAEGLFNEGLREKGPSR